MGGSLAATATATTNQYSAGMPPESAGAPPSGVISEDKGNASVIRERKLLTLLF